MDKKQHKKIWTDVNQILDLIFSDKSNELEGETDKVEVETDEDLLDDEIESSDEYDDASDTEEVEKDNKLGKEEVDVNMEEDFMLPVISNNITTTIYPPIITTTVDLQTDNFVDSVADVHTDSVLSCSVDNVIDNDVNTTDSSINTTTTNFDDIHFDSVLSSSRVNKISNFEISHDDPMEMCIDAVDNEEPCFSRNRKNMSSSPEVTDDEESENLIRKWSKGRKAKHKIVRDKIQQEVVVCKGHQRKHVRGGPHKSLPRISGRGGVHVFVVVFMVVFEVVFEVVFKVVIKVVFEVVFEVPLQLVYHLEEEMLYKDSHEDVDVVELV